MGARVVVRKTGWKLKTVDSRYFERLTTFKDPPYDFKKSFYAFDKHSGWIPTPDNEGIYRGYSYPTAEYRTPIRTNSAGFRSSDDYEYIEGKVRIAMMGDSFVQGLEVREEDSLPKATESELLRRGFQAKVYNFGVSGTGTAHQYPLFFHEALKIKPNLVILAFFPNDLINNSSAYEHDAAYLVPHYSIGGDGKVVIQEFADGPNRHTVSYGDPKEQKLDFFQKISVRLASMSYKDRSSVFFKIVSSLMVSPGYDAPFDVYKKEYPRPLKDSLDVTLSLIRQWNDYCISHEMKFILVLIPSKEQSVPAVWNQYIRERKSIMDESDFDTDGPNAFVKNAMEKSGVIVLDLLPIFKELAKKEDLYYKKDSHFNTKGDKSAAVIIASFLAKNNLLS